MCVGIASKTFHDVWSIVVYWKCVMRIWVCKAVIGTNQINQRDSEEDRRMNAGMGRKVF